MTSDLLLSSRAIPPEERLIVALDVPGRDEALALVERLGERVVFYKLGLELFLSGAGFELLEELRDRGKQIFADLKFFDVPATVASAVRQLARRPARFATVHGNETTLRAACREKKDLAILAVTVLTSLDRTDLAELRAGLSVEELVVSRARTALEAGCDGIICSGAEARAVRAALGPELLIVSPGIRPVDDALDDHKRAVDVVEAFRSGVDYIVMGRPIRNAPDPGARAREIQARIASIFG